MQQLGEQAARGTTKVHAFISINTADQISDMPANYCYHTNQPIYGPDGTSKLADDWADMMDNSIDMALNNAGARVLPDGYHWLSGSNSDGSFNTYDNQCNGFIDATNANFTMLGFSNDTDFGRIYAMRSACNNTYYIFCISEQ